MTMQVTENRADTRRFSAGMLAASTLALSAPEPVEKNELGTDRNARRFAVKREHWIQKKAAKLGKARAKAEQLAGELHRKKLRRFAAWGLKARAELMKRYGLTEAEAQAALERMLADPESPIQVTAPASPVNDGPFFGQDQAEAQVIVTDAVTGEVIDAPCTLERLPS